MSNSVVVTVLIRSIRSMPRGIEDMLLRLISGSKSAHAPDCSSLASGTADSIAANVRQRGSARFVLRSRQERND